MTDTYDLKSECGLSAFSLALSIASENPELASKLADLAEQSNEALEFSDALKEGALQGVEGETKTLAHNYSLKSESADMKFKAVLFGGIFDKTAQGDEALRIIGDEILNTGGTVSEGIELFRLIDEMNISSLTEVAKIMTDGDVEAARELVQNIRKKLSYYIGTDYSVVTSGSQVKLKSIIKDYENKIKSAQDKIDKVTKKLEAEGKKVNNLSRWLESDLKKVKEAKGNTVEGRNELKRLGDKYGIKGDKDLKKKLEKKLSGLKKAKDDLEEAKKTKKELMAAQEYKDALNGDTRIIEDGGNPFNLLEGDDEWKFIKEFDAEPSGRAQKYGQYVLARVLLTGGKDLPPEVIKVIKESIEGGVKNYLNETLTEDWIMDENRTLEELLARVYTNTADLANDGQLRNIYRQRLMELASDSEISVRDVDFIESLINTLQFASAGSGFSSVLKYQYLVRAANNLGLDIPSSRGEDLWDSIVNLFKKKEKDFGKAIAGDTVKLGNGVELTIRQLLELVADMLGSTNINKLIAADSLTDREILDIAGKYLIGDAKAGGNRLMELINAVKTTPTTDDTRGVILKTITGENVPQESKVGFFDFRRGLKAAPEVEARAKFMERLANANTLEIPNSTIPDLTDNLEQQIAQYKGGFILVNDAQWKMNKRLTDAIDKVNHNADGTPVKAEERVRVIYPKGGLSGTVKFVDGKIIFRTSDSSMFNTLVRSIAIRTLGQSNIDSKFTKDLQEKLLRGDVDAITEYNRLLEKDAKKYFGEMLGIKEEAYDEKLVPMLQELTGISFKNYNSIVDKVAFWKRVDDNFIVGLKTSGNIDQEFITVADVMREVDALSAKQLAERLSEMFGIKIDEGMISDKGKIKQGIKDAYLNYQLAQDPIELLGRKGKLLAMLNGGTADDITVSQFKAMLQSGNFDSYKDIFFHDANLSDEELKKHTNSINDMIFNALCTQMAMNLVKMGYRLPMVNIRDLVYDYLMDRLNVNGSFARAFLFKNDLPDTLEALRGVVNEAMPKELRFGYDDGYKFDIDAYDKTAIPRYTYDDGYDRLGHVIESRYNKNTGHTETILSNGTILIDGQRRWGNIANWLNLTDAFFEINTPSVVNGRTVRELADEYNIPLFIAQDSWLANFSKTSLGRTNSTHGEINGETFVQTMINLRKEIPEGTASHELFHAVFLTLAPDETKYFIDQAEKLYKLDPSNGHREANEMLADLFSEYFRTGSFTLPNAKKLQKDASFRAWIIEWFQKISNWLLGIDGYEKEVANLFDDILNGKLKTTTKKLGKGEIEAWNKANIQQRKNFLVEANRKKMSAMSQPKTSASNIPMTKAKFIETLDKHAPEVVEYVRDMYKRFQDGKTAFSNFDDWKDFHSEHFRSAMRDQDVSEEVRLYRELMYKAFSSVDEYTIDSLNTVSDLKKLISGNLTARNIEGFGMSSQLQEYFDKWYLMQNTGSLSRLEKKLKAEYGDGTFLQIGDDLKSVIIFFPNGEVATLDTIGQLETLFELNNVRHKSFKDIYRRDMLDDADADIDIINKVTKVETDKGVIGKHLSFRKDGTLSKGKFLKWFNNLPEEKKFSVAFRYMQFNNLLFSAIGSFDDMSAPRFLLNKFFGVSITHSDEEIMDMIREINSLGSQIRAREKLAFNNYITDDTLKFINTKIDGKYIGENYIDVIRKLYDDGYYPFEFHLAVDLDDGTVKRIILGTPDSVGGGEQGLPKGKNIVFFHNHPSGSIFSGIRKGGDLFGDVGAFVESKARGLTKEQGLILPGGVVVRFDNNIDLWNAILDKNMYNPTRRNIGDSGKAESILWFAIISARTKQLDKQMWGAYEPVINKHKDAIQRMADGVATLQDYKNFYNDALDVARDVDNQLFSKNMNRFAPYGEDGAYLMEGYNRPKTYTDPDMRFQERDGNLWFIEQPTEKEIDDYLSNNSVSDILLKRFGEAKNLDEGLFITRDGKIISGRYRPDIFPVNKIWADAGYRLNLEHTTAIETAVFDLWKNVGKANTYEDASKMLLDRVMDSEGLIRIRPRMSSNGNELIVTIASKGLSPQQEDALSKYISKFKEDLGGGIEGQIVVEAQWTDARGNFPGETIRVGSNTNIGDVNKILKEKINSQINERMSDEQVLKNRAKQKEIYGEGISLMRLGDSSKSYTHRPEPYDTDGFDRTGFSRPRNTVTPGYTTRVVERSNPYVSDTYSSLIAMAGVKDGVALPTLGMEENILEGILNRYYNDIAAATKGGKKLVFSEAQKKKTQAGYALDTFEQDYLIPRYKQFLTPQERSELLGLKYGLAVATDESSLKTIADYNDAVLDRYKQATNHIVMNNTIFSPGINSDININKEIEERQKQLLEQGATLKYVNGQIVVTDIREDLLRELKNIPNTILGLENLKSIGRNGLAQMSNESVFFLLNVVQLAKNLDNKTNIIMQTIYKVDPRLARLDFFNTYRVVDGVPKILRRNLLSESKELSKFQNTIEFDTETKKTILSGIKNKIASNGRITSDDLSKIVADSITENLKSLSNSIKGRDVKRFRKEAALIYEKAFTPYTYLLDVPREVKSSIANILAEQQRGLRLASSLIGGNDSLLSVMDNIYIYSMDGTVKTFRQLLEDAPDDINKILFNTDSEIIMAADEAAKKPTTGKMSKRAKRKNEMANIEIVKGVENNYSDGLNAYLNDSETVSEAERKLLTTTLTAARQLAKKYTTTNRIAETDNALASINEEIIRRFKADILGLDGKFTKGGQRLDFGGKIQDGILSKWKNVQERYKYYYSMDIDQLSRIRVSNPTDTIAVYLAKYFKEIETRLGSLDGVAGVTTDMSINRAFGHLGEIVLNVKTMNGLYSLMSGIEGNQILKFFRFSNPKQASYVKRFVIGGEGKETVGGYRTYVDKTDEGLDRDWFNKTFATNFTQSEYKKLIQALTGFTIVDKRWKKMESALNFINSSNYIFRALMSYPGQMLTVANQSIAYFLRQIGWEENLGIEDLGSIDEIRKRTGILNGTYNEINLFNGYSPDDLDPTSFYNRYGIPDVEDVYKKKKFYSTDDIETIYSKIDEYGASSDIRDKINDKWTKFIRNTDAYKDNANNIIDGIFARNFKNIAFVRALQNNQVMRFSTAEQFARFMASGVPEGMKKRLLDAVASDSGKHFRNILGLGFSGLDRAVSGGAKYFPAWASNILVGLMQVFNFRGAWGQNIARQTNGFFVTALKMGKMGVSKEGRDAIALYLARQPEFVNFAWQLFMDLRNSWRLVRFQDNGQLPDENDTWSWLDFINYSLENMKFASQWWQGIQSYGTSRIITEWGGSVIKSHAQPDIYKDTWGVGAFFNALAKNAGRNWKVPKFIMGAVAQGTTNGTEAFWEYMGNEWWKLSFGTLRYLMNEDYTSYGYSTELPTRKTGIPFIITGEVNEEGDKAFSYDLANTETRENILNWYNAKKSGDTEAASIYAINLWDTAFNSSQFLGTIKGAGRAINGSALVGDTIKGLMDDVHFYKASNPFDLAEAGDLMAETEAGMAMQKYGYYIPSQATDVKTFIDAIIGQSDFRPGNEGFNKSFFNFDNSGHMKNLEESNQRDTAMEMLLTNMKYKRDENWDFILDEKGQKIVTDYWAAHMDEIERKINDADFLVNSNFNFIYNWVEQNRNDPNYMLYKKLIGEGLAGHYLENKINEHISGFNDVFGLKKTEKLTLTELKNSELYDVVIPMMKSRNLVTRQGQMPFLEALATLDEDSLREADIKIVERQLGQLGNQDAVRKFFNVNDKGEVSLTTKYEEFLEEQGKLSSYLRAGDIDSFLAETASITKVFKKDDPYAIMTTTLLGSRVNQINNSDYLSAEQKAKAINVLFKDNAEFIQQHIPDMISELGDVAGVYIDQMNDSLYGSSIIADKLITDNEMDNSSSGRKAAKSASDTIKAVIVDLAKAAGDSEKIGVKRYNYNFTPVQLNGTKLLNLVGGKGYEPESPSLVITSYTPHANFSISKDINRSVKGPKTETISKKKQLNKLESDVEKALEAES